MVKLGAMAKEMPKATGVVGRDKKGQTRGSSGVPRVGEPATYADLGLDKKTIAKAQQLADLPAHAITAIATGEKCR